MGRFLHYHETRGILIRGKVDFRENTVLIFSSVKNSPLFAQNLEQGGIVNRNTPNVILLSAYNFAVPRGYQLDGVRLEDLGQPEEDK